MHCLLLFSNLLAKRKVKINEFPNQKEKEKEKKTPIHRWERKDLYNFVLAHC